MVFSRREPGLRTKLPGGSIAPCVRIDAGLKFFQETDDKLFIRTGCGGAFFE